MEHPAGEIQRQYYRVIERADGTWACHHDHHHIDHHHDVNDALWHTAEIARAHRPSRILLHHLDGRTLSIATID